MIAGLADFWRRRKLMIIVGVAFLCLVAVFVHVRVQPLRRRSADKERSPPSPASQNVQWNKGNSKKKNKNKLFVPPPFIQKMKNKPKGLGQGWPNPQKVAEWKKQPGWGKPPAQNVPPVPGKNLPGPNMAKDKPVQPGVKPPEPGKGKDESKGGKIVENVDEFNVPKKGDGIEKDDSKKWMELDGKKKESGGVVTTTGMPLVPGSRGQLKKGKRKGFGRKKVDIPGEAEEEEAKKEGKALPGLKKEDKDMLEDEDEKLSLKDGRLGKAGSRRQDGRIPGQMSVQEGRRGMGPTGSSLDQGKLQQPDRLRPQVPGSQWNQNQQRQGQMGQPASWNQRVGDQAGKMGQWGQQGRNQFGQQVRNQPGQFGQPIRNQPGQFGQQVRNQPGQFGQQVRNQPGQSGQQQFRNQQGQFQGNQFGQQGQGSQLNQQGQRFGKSRLGQQNRQGEWNPQGSNQALDDQAQGVNNPRDLSFPGGRGMNRLQGGGGLARHLTSLNPQDLRDVYVHTTTPIGTPPSLERTKHQQAVVDAFRHSWNAYSKHAWGMDEYNPLTQKGVNTLFGQGLTIVDSLDTLWMMGLHEEYQRARAWVADNLDIEHNSKTVSIFETTIRVLGGLLGIYHLTGDKLYLDKATKFATRLLPAFDTPSDIPSASINLATGGHESKFSTITVAEAGSLQLEFRDLYRATGNMTFKRACDNAMDQILSSSGGGMVSMTINVQSGTFQAGVYTAGAGVDSYYEYLLKQWLQSGKTETKFRDAYTKSTREVLSQLVGTSKPHNMAYLGMKGSRTANKVSTSMDHLSCFYPGMLALGVMNNLLPDTQKMAENLTHTCYYMYNITTPTHLAPEMFHFNNQPRSMEDVLRSSDPQNVQRPETVESLFYLYRLTKDEKYREWAWKIFEAFRNSSKLDEGYTSLSSVYLSGQYKDRMESFFLAETLKYLFLIFGEDDSFLSLNEWVFNTEAHPLPIWKVNQG